jgi:hypothetical protein
MCQLIRSPEPDFSVEERENRVLILYQYYFANFTQHKFTFFMCTEMKVKVNNSSNEKKSIHAEPLLPTCFSSHIA